ncbi:MAG: TetR/AcrR family transcriptional regulator [Syntrophomonadaceae bacterium]
MKASRKEMERQFKKDFVGDIALDLFRRSHFDRVSMDEIAREAEFGKGTLYKLFSGKEEILVHVICRGIQDLRTGLESKCLDGRPPTRMLETLVELEYDFYTQYSNLVVALMLREGNNLEPEFLERIREQKRLHVELLERILAVARAAGLSIDTGDREFIRALEAVMKGLMVLQIEQPAMEVNREQDLLLIRALLGKGLITWV